MTTIYGKLGGASAVGMAERQRLATCNWHLYDVYYGGPWETECGNAFELNDGTPKDNNMQFCCYCGKPLTWSKRSDEQENYDE